MCWAQSSAFLVRVSFSASARTPYVFRRLFVRSRNVLASLGMHPAAARASSTITRIAPKERRLDGLDAVIVLIALYASQGRLSPDRNSSHRTATLRPPPPVRLAASCHMHRQPRGGP